MEDRGALAPAQQRKDEGGTDGAQQQQLADAVVGDQPFPERMVDGEQEHTGEIEADTRTGGGQAGQRHFWAAISAMGRNSMSDIFSFAWFVSAPASGRGVLSRVSSLRPHRP